MCGRFSLITVGEFLSDRFKVEVDDRVQARYNIAPSTDIPIITNDESSKITMARWGLVPTWAKDQSIGYKMINARAETVAEKSAYRVPFRKHRCLIPADGFYEWKKANGKKIPYRIIMKDKDLFAFAGLFDIWHHNEIEIISCTIITTSPNKVVAPIHDRMPVILSRDNEMKWLAEENETRLQEMLRPYPPDDMDSIRISEFINTPGNEGEEVVKPVKSLLDY